MRQILLRIPNLPHADAPDGEDDGDNPVIKGPIGMPSSFADHQRVPHWDIATKLGILDNDRATKIAASMFTMQRGLGATMARALCQLALDQNADDFEEIRPPTLPYRIIEICTGDMGQSHHRSYDIEVYAPGCDAWLEVSSVSWFSDYQARRADIRLRRAGQKGTDIAHTLNGSALAVPRVWAAIIENNHQPDGTVMIPEVLRPYMRGADVIRPRTS